MIALMLGAGTIQAQDTLTVDFENPVLPTLDTHFVAQSEIDNFLMLDATFGSTATTSQWGTFYSGFTYSNRTDVTTAGFTNPYSAFPGEGADGSDQFAVFYSSNDTLSFTAPTVLVDAQFTNNTYAGISMRDGDSFAKQFGSTTNAAGDDDGTNGEDFLFVRFTGWDVDGNITDSVDIYLADFRFSDNTQDYILEDWTTFDLSALGIITKVTFSFGSSDVGQFGINTPTYFAMDNMRYYNYYAGLENEQVKVSVYPNPATSQVSILGAEGNAKIFSTSGKLVYANKISSNQKIDVSSFETGIYYLTVETKNGSATQKLIVQ